MRNIFYFLSLIALMFFISPLSVEDQQATPVVVQVDTDVGLFQADILGSRAACDYAEKNQLIERHVLKTHWDSSTPNYVGGEIVPPPNCREASLYQIKEQRLIGKDAFRYAFNSKQFRLLASLFYKPIRDNHPQERCTPMRC